VCDVHVDVVVIYEVYKVFYSFYFFYSTAAFIAGRLETARNISVLFSLDSEIAAIYI
jgi:hypothetical protein